MSVRKSQAFKTVFLGDSNVGKTCLAKLYVEGEVVQATTHTIGFDHHVKELEIEENLPIKVAMGCGWVEGVDLCDKVGSLGGGSLSDGCRDGSFSWLRWHS